jgi:hypothetical protein
MTMRRTEQARMVRAFADATKTPSTRSKMEREQVEEAVNIMNDAVAAGATLDPTEVVGAINQTYTRLNGP